MVERRYERYELTVGGGGTTIRTGGGTGLGMTLGTGAIGLKIFVVVIVVSSVACRRGGVASKNTILKIIVVQHITQYNK